MSDKVKIQFKLFLEAEDISQSRILSSTAFIKNKISTHRNPYISRAVLDDESDLEDFILRLYVEEEMEEAACTDRDAAERFADEVAELVTEIAHAHSFLDMEGSFSIQYEAESLAYTFISESGDGGCDFQEIESIE